MKLLAVAAMTTVAIAQLNDELDDRKFNHLIQMTWSKVEPNTQLDMKNFKKQLLNYGCYCLPSGNGANQAQAGAPVDYIDKACRDLAKCYKCLDLDYQRSPDEKYAWFPAASNGGEISCNHPKNDEAKRNHCECDAEFANTLGAQWDDNNYDYSKWDFKKNTQYSFDKENVCVAGPTKGRSDQCCGNYPHRSPYMNTILRCCDGKLEMAC